jgi:23S rRNA pseudouridine2605 synthase
MRINRFVAQSTGCSRRAADRLIEQGDVFVNQKPAQTGYNVTPHDVVSIRDKILHIPETQTILLNKPAGYVCSRDGQGSKTIYDLLPAELHNLKPVGRLDKDSSGLLLLTNDGELAQSLTHPSHQKNKVYEVTLDSDLQPLHRQMISDRGIQLDDGPSQFELERIVDGNEKAWRVTMHEGRNRQIRRTFEALGYTVTKLHRTNFGTYSLNLKLGPGSYTKV